MTIWVIKKSVSRERNDGKFHLYPCNDIAVAETHEAAIKKMHDDAEFYLTDSSFEDGTIVEESDYLMKIITKTAGRTHRKKEIVYNIVRHLTDENIFY